MTINRVRSRLATITTVNSHFRFTFMFRNFSPSNTFYNRSLTIDRVKDVASRVPFQHSTSLSSYVMTTSLLNQKYVARSFSSTSDYRSLPSESINRLKLRRAIDESHPVSVVTMPGRMNQILSPPLLLYARLMRLDKQTGTMLLLFPCLWSISLASSAGHLPNLPTIGLFTIGAVLMRAAGCIVNDMWDRSIDRHVQRTKDRPLASGELSMLDAWCLLSTCLTGALHLLLLFDKLTILYGVSSLALVVTYPLMKRITYWPQLFLGLTFNWGAMLGWSAIHLGAIDWTVIGPLYLAGIFWTLIYDTIYAYQDFNYDKKVGIKSTAIRFGKQPKVWLSAFSTAMIANFLVVGIMADQTWPYYVALGLSTTRLAEIVYNLDINNAQDCGRRFRQNQQIGMIMLVGIIVGTLFKPKTSTTTLPAEEHSIQQSLLEKHPHVI